MRITFLQITALLQSFNVTTQSVFEEKLNVIAERIALMPVMNTRTAHVRINCIIIVHFLYNMQLYTILECTIIFSVTSHIGALYF